MEATEKQLKKWKKEKILIPVMIAKYCKGKHKGARKEQGIKGKELCPDCRELLDYALFRLDKCPFKVNKGFCSFCKVHCYKPDMRQKMKEVMKYSGHRMIFTHPVFAFSHVFQLIKYKRGLKKREQKRVVEMPQPATEGVNNDR